MSYENTFRSLQQNILQLQDISVILIKLESQGSIRKMTQLFNQIFEIEHEFTISELKRAEKESNAQDPGSMREQYTLNSQIFLKNFTLIAQDLIDQVAQEYLARFRKAYLPSSFDEHRETEISVPFNYQNDEARNNMNLSVSTTQLKSDTEPREMYDPPNTATLLSSSELSSPQRYESVSATLNTKELETIESEEQSPAPVSDKGIGVKKSNSAVDRTAQSEQIKHPALKEQQKTSSTSQTFVSPNETRDGSFNYQTYKQGGNSKNFNPKSRHTESLSSYNKQNIDNSQEQSYSRSFNVQETGNLGYRKESQSKNHQNTPYYSNRSPQLKTRSPGSTGSNFNRSHTSSSSRIIPDPQALYSEFSYLVPGGAIPKSKRKLREDPLEVPGPGHYETQDILKRGSPQTFSKSERMIVDKNKLEIPGPVQYYPVKHFTSNFS